MWRGSGTPNLRQISGSSMVCSKTVAENWDSKRHLLELFFIKQMLKISPFYLEKQKSSIPKKMWAVVSKKAKIVPTDGFCCPNFQRRFWFAVLDILIAHFYSIRLNPKKMGPLQFGLPVLTKRFFEFVWGIFEIIPFIHLDKHLDGTWDTFWIKSINGTFSAL